MGNHLINFGMIFVSSLIHIIQNRNVCKYCSNMHLLNFTLYIIRFSNFYFSKSNWYNKNKNRYIQYYQTHILILQI